MLGFYPQAGTTNYVLGSPVFPKVVIHRTEGNITIIAHNASQTNIYVTQVLSSLLSPQHRFSYPHKERDAQVQANGVSIPLQAAFSTTLKLQRAAYWNFGCAIGRSFVFVSVMSLGPLMLHRDWLGCMCMYMRFV